MTNERIPQEGLRRINISYDPETQMFTNREEVIRVQGWQDTGSIETPTPVTKKNLFADEPQPVIESSVVYHPEPVQTKQHEAINEQSKSDKKEKRRGGRTFLKIGAAAATLATLYYAGDVASSYIKDREVVSPAEAYDDFINLPSLVTVITESLVEDKIDETVENITGGKE